MMDEDIEGMEGYETEIVPEELKGLRACLSCSLVKTEDQFLQNGCESKADIFCAWAVVCQVGVRVWRGGGIMWL